jgi:hypothetical protein
MENESYVSVMAIALEQSMNLIAISDINKSEPIQSYVVRMAVGQVNSQYAEVSVFNSYI